MLFCIAFTIYTIITSWFFISNQLDYENYVMSLIVGALFLIGVSFGPLYSFITSLISVFVYGSFKIGLSFLSGYQLIAGTQEFFWIVIMPISGYIGGLLGKTVDTLIQKAVSYDELIREKITYDKLTDLPTAKMFAYRVSEEISRARRYKNIFSILLIKIDYLDELKDVYGENTQKIVIKTVAEVLKGNKRTEDFLARITNDEFAFLLPNTDKSGAIVLRNRMKGKLSYVDVNTSDEKDFKRIKLTIRSGISSYPEDGEDYFPLISAARREYEIFRE